MLDVSFCVPGIIERQTVPFFLNRTWEFVFSSSFAPKGIWFAHGQGVKNGCDQCEYEYCSAHHLWRHLTDTHR